MDRSTDYPYGSNFWVYCEATFPEFTSTIYLCLPSTDHPPKMKIRNKHFTDGLSNRLLIPAKFRVSRYANIINTPHHSPPHPPPPPPPQRKKVSKSCFHCKEMPMTKRRTLLILHSWLNRAMGGVFLGCLSFFVAAIMKP